MKIKFFFLSSCNESIESKESKSKWYYIVKEKLIFFLKKNKPEYSFSSVPFYPSLSEDLVIIDCVFHDLQRSLLHYNIPCLEASLHNGHTIVKLEDVEDVITICSKATKQKWIDFGFLILIFFFFQN